MSVYVRDMRFVNVFNNVRSQGKDINFEDADILQVKDVPYLSLILQKVV